MNSTPTQKLSKSNYNNLLLRIDAQDIILKANSDKLDRVVAALIGDEYSVEAGLIEQVKRHNKRLRVLEVVYIGGVAVISVGGVILGILDKLKQIL